MVTQFNQERGFPFLPHRFAQNPVIGMAPAAAAVGIGRDQGPHFRHRDEDHRQAEIRMELTCEANWVYGG